MVRWGLLDGAACRITELVDNRLEELAAVAADDGRGIATGLSP